MTNINVGFSIFSKHELLWEELIYIGLLLF